MQSIRKSEKIEGIAPTVQDFCKKRAILRKIEKPRKSATIPETNSSHLKK